MTVRDSFFPELTAPIVTMPGVPGSAVLTPEGVARFAGIEHDTAPHGWRVTGVAVYSGATGEWYVGDGTGNGTIGGPARAGRYSLDRQESRSWRLSEWADAGAGVEVASVLEPDWSCAP